MLRALPVDADFPESGDSASGGSPVGAGRPGSRLRPPAPSTWQGPSCLLNRQKLRGKKEQNEGGKEISKVPSAFQVSRQQCYIHVSFYTCPGAERWAVGGSLTGGLLGLSGRARCPARGEIQKAKVIPHACPPGGRALYR